MKIPESTVSQPEQSAAPWAYHLRRWKCGTEVELVYVGRRSVLRLRDQTFADARALVFEQYGEMVELE